MKFVLEISCNGAAFEDEYAGSELASILHNLATQVEKGYTVVYLHDTNGNHVGVAKFVHVNNEEIQ